jgi:spore germination protein (amino acid permease)
VDRKENSLLVPSEAMHILIGTMIGIGIFNLSSVLVKDAHEDAWLSAILGGIYPLYLGLLGIYIIKKHPSENILDISKSYLGEFAGTVLNMLFLVFFISNTTFVISGFSIVYRVYATAFLSPFRIISITVLLAAITAYRGLKLIGKINTVAFYITLIILIESFIALRKGSHLNLMPVLGTDVANILKSTKESVFSYTGLEILFILYPSVKNNLKFGKEVLKAIGITVMIYAFTTALALYYLSADIIQKSYWPLITVSESLKLAVVNNFRVIFAFFWMAVALKSAANYYFASTFICSNILKKVKRINIIGALYLIIVPITLMLGESTVRNKVMKMVVGKVVLYNLFYITIIAVLIFIKKGVRNESK